MMTEVLRAELSENLLRSISSIKGSFPQIFPLIFPTILKIENATSNEIIRASQFHFRIAKLLGCIKNQQSSVAAQNPSISIKAPQKLRLCSDASRKLKFSWGFFKAPLNMLTAFTLLRLPYWQRPQAEQRSHLLIIWNESQFPVCKICFVIFYFVFFQRTVVSFWPLPSVKYYNFSTFLFFHLSFMPKVLHGFLVYSINPLIMF